MVVPVLASRVPNNMAGNNLYDSSVESYGTISKSAGVRNVGRAKISTASKVAPLIFLAVMIGLACIASTLQKDEHQVDQVKLLPALSLHY